MIDTADFQKRLRAAGADERLAETLTAFFRETSLGAGSQYITL